MTVNCRGRRDHFSTAHCHLSPCEDICLLLYCLCLLEVYANIYYCLLQIPYQGKFTLKKTSTIYDCIYLPECIRYEISSKY